MMLFFRSKAQKELDFILQELKNFLANNYKDQAHDCRKLLGKRTQELYAAGKLTKAQYQQYHAKYVSYTELMKDYHH